MDYNQNLTKNINLKNLKFPNTSTQYILFEMCKIQKLESINKNESCTPLHTPIRSENKTITKKHYKPVSNEQRKYLIELIHGGNPFNGNKTRLSISKAAQIAGVYYPTAKAINKVYLRENRTQKKEFRFRLKKIDKNRVVVRNKILVERLLHPHDNIGSCSNKSIVSNPKYLVCGIKVIRSSASLRDMSIKSVSSEK